MIISGNIALAGRRMKKSREFPAAAYRNVVRFVGSDSFFYAVLLLAALQALWYIASLKPVVNDEARHVANIVIYSQQLSPFLTDQSPSWDRLGEVVRDGSYMFYYLISWPLRLIKLFTDNNVAQLTGLRLVSTAIFITALSVYRQALLAIQAVPRSAVNFVFLFLVLLPTVAILPATVNYDNMVMLLFAAILLLAIRILQTREATLLQLTGLLALSLFTTVVKWTAIALVVPVLIFVGVSLWGRWRLRAGTELLRIWSVAQWWQRVVAVVLVLLALGLFIERPVMNALWYGSPDPPCQKVIGARRCAKSPDYASYASLAAHRPQGFAPLDPVRFGLRYWVPEMLHRTGNVYELTTTEVPSYKFIIGTLLIVGTAATLLAFRRLRRYPFYQFLMIVTLVYTGTLFISNYMGYRTYGVPVAIRTRYLIPVLPLVGYIMAWSVLVGARIHQRWLLLGSMIVILLTTQGGGISTYALTTPQHVYWDNGTVRSFNYHLRQVLGRFVLR